MISASSAKRSRASPARRSSQNFARVDLLPDPDGYGQPSPPPRVDHKNGARRTSSRGGRCYPKAKRFRPQGETNFVQKGFAPFHQAKGISSKPTSSPAMANTVDLHLLPRIDQQNDTRRILPRRVLLFFRVDAHSENRSGNSSWRGSPCRQSSAPLSSTPRFFHWLSGKMSGAPPIGAYQESTTHSVPLRSLITAVQWG